MKTTENKTKKTKNDTTQAVNNKDIIFYIKNFSENLSSLIINDKNKSLSQNHNEKYETAYDTLFTNDIPYNNNHILFISLITFHHKLGGIIECTFPPKEELISNEELNSLIDKDNFPNSESVIEHISNNLVNYCLIDGIHLTNNDTNFFFIHDFKKPLYCISYYIQKKTDKKENNTEDNFQENIRGCIQKSICIVSTLPLFGNINAYQNYYTNISHQMIQYMNQKSLNDKCVLNEIYNKLINEFNFHKDKKWLFNLRKTVILLKEDLIIILKLILLEKTIIIYSQIPSNASLLIMSLLSILPGNFIGEKTFFDKQNGTPFKIFNEKYLIYPLFTLFDLDKLLDKINNEGINYLIGTTNKLIVENQNLNYSCLINVDKGKIKYGYDISEDIKHFNRNENKVMKSIYELINNNSEDKNIKNKKDEIWILKNNENDKKEFYYIKKYLLSYYLKIIFDISYLIEEIKKNISNDPYGLKLINFYESIEIKYHKSISTTQTFYCTKDKNDNNSFNAEDTLPLIENIISDPTTYTICSILPIKLSNSQSTKKTPQEKKRESILSKINILSFISQWSNTTNFKKWFNSYDKQIINYSTLNIQETKTSLYDFDDNFYKGSMVLGKKEGNGQYDYKTLKMIYNGNFKNDLREGTGNLTSYDEKFYYEGEWVANKMEGNGVLYSSQLGKYSGHFHKDCFEGHGSLIDKNDNIYEGNFVKGEKNGEGELKLSDGSSYVGEFKHNKYHGKGILKDSQGNIILEGEFKLGSLYKPKKNHNKKEIIIEKNDEQIKNRNTKKRKSLNPLYDSELERIQNIKFFDEYDEMGINIGGNS